MKKTLTVFLTLLCSAMLTACAGNEFAYDAKSYTLELNLYDITKFETSNEGKTHTEDAYSDYTFDNTGKLISKEEGSHQITYAYDANGQLISEEENGTNAKVSSRTYVYSDTGALVSSTLTELRGSQEDITEITYTCDDANRVIKETRVSGDGDTTITTYTYDAHSRIINEEDQYSDGDTWTHSYTYNAKGDMIKYSMSTSDYDFITDYQLDSLGHAAQGDTVEDDGSILKFLFTNEAVATLEISPETNPELMTPDKWVSVEGARGLPSPDSCVSTIKPVAGEGKLMFQVEASNNMPWLYDDTLYMNEAEKLEYQKYQLILEKLCGFDLQTAEDGSITISKDDKSVAVMDYTFDDNFGFCIVIDLIKS